MEQRELTREEIIEKIDNLSQTGKFVLWYNAKHFQEDQSEKYKISQLFSNYGNYTEEIIKIKDNAFIVHVKNSKQTGFYADFWSIVINEKNLSEVYPDQESALVSLVCYLKTGNTQAALWMLKLID
jgi:hypothetical protein